VQYYPNGENNGFYIGYQLSIDHRRDTRIWDNSIKPDNKLNAEIVVGYSF